MARDRATTASTPHPAPRTVSRRALFTLTAPALGAAGFAATLLRHPRPARGDDGAEPSDNPDDPGLTAHRQAYYNRARF